MNAKTHRFMQKNAPTIYRYDYFQLQLISSHLIEKHSIPPEKIKLDWYLVLYPDNAILGIYEKIDSRSFSKKFIVHSPDVVICDEYDMPLLIIELDGKIHHETNKKKNKTKRRNKNYHLANNPLIIIESDDLKLDDSWKKFLDDSIKKLFGDDDICKILNYTEEASQQK